MWLPAERCGLRAVGLHGLYGLLMVAGLTGAALLAHALPLGIQDVPHQAFGMVALLGMVALYLCLVVLQLRPQALRTWRFEPAKADGQPVMVAALQEFNFSR